MQEFLLALNASFTSIIEKPAMRGSHVACQNLKMPRVAVLSHFPSLLVLVRIKVFLKGFAILFYVLSLLVGPCRSSEFTLVGLLYSPVCGHKLNRFDKASADVLKLCTCLKQYSFF